MGGRELFTNQVNGPAATWLDDAMGAISNAPPGFQSTFNRLMESETAASPAFREIMEAQVKAEDRTPRTEGRNRRQSLVVMTPDEVMAVWNLSEF